MKQEDVLTFRETAKLLRYSPRTWSRRWKSFVATKRFPAHLTGTRSHPRWSRTKVVDWIETNGGNEKPPQANDDSEDHRFNRACEEYANAANT